MDPVTDYHDREADDPLNVHASSDSESEEGTRKDPAVLSLLEEGLLVMEKWQTCTEADRQVASFSQTFLQIGTLPPFLTFSDSFEVFQGRSKPESQQARCVLLLA